MIQRERELEGDEFKDKDAFVTQAYKDKMAEVRRAEEEERVRNGTPLAMLMLNADIYVCRAGEKEEWFFNRNGTFLSQNAG